MKLQIKVALAVTGVFAFFSFGMSLYLVSGLLRKPSSEAVSGTTVRHFTLFLPKNRNYYFNDIMNGALKSAAEHGAVLSVHTIDSEGISLRMAAYSGVEGVVVCPDIDDAIKCADFMAEQAGVNPDRIGIMGWSMGGGVALLTAGTDARFKSVLTWAGAYYDGKINEEEYAVALKDGYYEATFDWRDPLKQGPKMYEVQQQLKVSEIFPQSIAPV
ncbi:MAG TPA: prolyl oligopeptidase family serine peptidase, partial [Treponemataceae bacterium]|nr:prolyl oligopeptidase family serine peptidase [Treponemataceae bacterium]